jgi:hypothetical protein
VAESPDPVAGAAGDQAPTETPIAPKPQKRGHWIDRILRLNYHKGSVTPNSLPQRMVRSLFAADYFGIGKFEARSAEAREAKQKLANFDLWPARLQRAFMDVFGIKDPTQKSDDRTVELKPIELSRLQRAADKRTRRRIRNLGMSLGEQRVHSRHGFTTGDMLAALHGDKTLQHAMWLAWRFKGRKIEHRPVQVWVDTAA